MKLFPLITIAFATEDPDVYNCWPANPDAPYCGCQWIFRDQTMINNTCLGTFTDDIHMLTVASSFSLPEHRSRPTPGEVFAWTGYDGLSHADLHDMVWFYEQDVCNDGNGEAHNATTLAGLLTAPTVVCTPNLDGNGDIAAWPGPRLGNFNYDIARSVQRYTLPIYGMENDGTVYTVTVNQMANQVFDELNIRNVSAHHGHGTATKSSADCDGSGQFTYAVDAEHQGELEYAQFYLCDADVDSDYTWDVPSTWDSEIL